MRTRDRAIIGLVIGCWLAAHLMIQFGPKLEYASGMVIGALIGYLGEPIWKYTDKYVDLAFQKIIDFRW